MKLTIPKIAQQSWQGGISFNNAEDGFSFDLKNGEHAVLTPPVNVAFLTENPKRKLTASLELQYEYIEEMNAVKLSAGDYSGKEAPRLIINEGEKQLCKFGNSQNDYIVSADKDVHMLEQELSSYLQNAAEQLIKNAEDAGLQVLIRENMVVLPPEQMEDLKVVYKNGCFAGLYDPDKKYSEDTKIAPVSSIFGGKTKCPKGTAFWNVNGSTNDTPRGSNSWIEFWVDNSKDILSGCVVNNRACNGGYDRYSSRWVNIYGGHVVNDHKLVNPRPGVHGVVFILPICNAHNNSSNTAQMTTAFDTTAVWLDYYHQ